MHDELWNAIDELMCSQLEELGTVADTNSNWWRAWNKMMRVAKRQGRQCQNALHSVTTRLVRHRYRSHSPATDPFLM